MSRPAHATPLHLVTVLTVVVFASVFAAPSLHAQLGKLKKAAADAAKEAAGVKKPEAATAGSDFTITAERLDAVMAVLEPNVDRLETMSRDRVARAKAKADYEEATKAFSKCLEANATGRIPTPADMQRVQSVTDKLSDLTVRAQQLLQARKFPEYVAVQDSSMVFTMKYTATMYSLETKCGNFPYRPQLIRDEDVANLSGTTPQRTTSASTTNSLKVPANNRAGMTTQQFGMIRERMALWSLQQTGNAPVTGSGSKYAVFTPAEQALMDARAERIKRMAPLFKDGTMMWAAWGDLENW